MPWWEDDPSDRAIFAELDNAALTDRALGVMASALIDYRLASRIKGGLRGSKKEIDKYLSSTLNSFYSRIEYGYFHGMYSNVIRLGLHGIRDIRNDFSHIHENITFTTKNIKERCEKLPIIPHFAVGDFLYGGKSAAAAFVIGGPTPVPTDPREIFLETVKLLLGVISIRVREPAPEPEL